MSGERLEEMGGEELLREYGDRCSAVPTDCSTSRQWAYNKERLRSLKAELLRRLNPERPPGEEKQRESVGPKGSEEERLLHISVLEKEGCSCDAMNGFSCGIHELARMAREMQR